MPDHRSHNRSSVLGTLAVALVLVIGVAGCSGSGHPGSTTSGSTTSGSTPSSTATASTPATTPASTTLTSTTQPSGPGRGRGLASGVVWYDINSDGRRQPDEPGVAGVVVARLGTADRTTSGPDGRWTLSVPAGHITISALTGWLPSACPGDLHCRAHRTADQAFAVENQFLRVHLTVRPGERVGALDLGLAPDYGDPTGSPSSIDSGNDRGDGPPHVHDLAARNSSIGLYKGCADPSHIRACPRGLTLPVLGQIYNQGTAAGRQIRFVVTVPPGLSMVAPPTPDPATPGPAPTPTGRRGRDADGSTWIEYRLGRDLAPAAAVWFESSYRIVGGPPSPRPFGTGTHYDRKIYLSITAVSGGDDDSPLRVDPRRGLDHGHNVNAPARIDDDTSDAIEFNVA